MNAEWQGESVLEARCPFADAIIPLEQDAGRRAVNGADAHESRHWDSIAESNCSTKQTGTWTGDVRSSAGLTLGCCGSSNEKLDRFDGLRAVSAVWPEECWNAQSSIFG